MKLRGKLVVVVAGAACISALAASPSGSVTARKTSPTIGARVSVMDNYFDPRSVTIEKGEAVKWNWKGENRHNVVFTKVPDDATKKHARARVDGAAIRTLTTPGSYYYECSLYDGMQGKVTVTDR